VRQRAILLPPFSLQRLYLMPEDQMTKDHLKAVLIGRKKLLKLKEVNEVVVPFYDELSVKAWYAKMLVRPELQPFFPDSFAKGR
jgi:hypothetical protein